MGPRATSIHQNESPSVFTLKFIICNFLQSSCLPFVVSISRHILVIDLKLYFLHAPSPLGFSIFGHRATTSASLASFPAQNLSTSTNDYRQPRVNKFKKFSRFSFAEKEAASCYIWLQCFSSTPTSSCDPSFGKFLLRKWVPCLVTVQKHGSN